jgi:hypothetical protein
MLPEVCIFHYGQLLLKSLVKFYFNFMKSDTIQTTVFSNVMTCSVVPVYNEYGGSKHLWNGGTHFFKLHGVTTQTSILIEIFTCIDI